MSSCHRRKAGRKRCRVGTMSLATSCDITRSGAGGIRCHSTEGVAEERRGGGSGSGGQTGVGSRNGRRAGVGSVRGSPYRRDGEGFHPLLVTFPFILTVSGRADAKGLGVQGTPIFSFHFFNKFTNFQQHAPPPLLNTKYTPILACTSCSGGFAHQTPPFLSHFDTRGVFSTSPNFQACFTAGGCPLSCSPV